MLSATVFLPWLGLLVIFFLPKEATGAIRLTAVCATLATLAIAVLLAFAFDPAAGFQFVERIEWIPTLGVGYVVGLDGLSLPLFMLTATLFAAALVFSWPERERAKEYFGWFLFLETACLGVFAARDLFLFYVFWDLTLVGMFFIIAIWGHEGARAAAFKFFLYTFVGSMALLLGIIGIYIATDPLTMDMTQIAAQRPLADHGWLAGVVFFALLVGFGIKTPVVPVHTWLPPAHAEAPAAGSAILAGILLKMGAYGFVRILLQLMPEELERHALLVVAIGVVSVIYGSLVALAQQDLKRLIAYTSVNHMGYVVMAVGAAALLVPELAAARELALNGAILQMVSHGLITGALFLFAGVMWHRAKTFDLNAFGGLAQITPVLAGAMSFAAFASLGLPGLSGFVAEFQIFVGTFGVYPWAAATALVGVVITAGLFLWTLQRLFLGKRNERWHGMPDMSAHERLAIFPLLVLVLAIGIAPFWILEIIDGFSRAAVRGAGL